MAQIYKEKVNIELKTDDFEETGKVTLFQNDASTQFIIHDIIIENGTNGYIKNNNISIAPLDLSSTGTEIVERNGIIEAEIAWNSKIYSIQSSTGVLEMDMLTGLSSSIVTPTMSSPCCFFKTDKYAYYFSYDGNSTTYVYRATILGDSIGAWGAIATSGYSFRTFDNNRKKIMWVSGITYGEYDMDSSVSISQVLSTYGISQSTGSYTQAANINGWFFYVPTSSYDDYCFGFNYEKGIVIRITGVYDLTDNCGLAACYDPESKKYIILFRSSTNVYKQEILTDIDSLSSSTSIQVPTFTDSTPISMNTPIQSSTSKNVICGTLDGKLLYIGQDEQIYLVNVLNPTEQGRIGISFGIDSTYGGLSCCQREDIDIKIKISGIEIR